jgi:putative ABC transport system permease protein
MLQGDVSFLGLALSLVLVAVAVGLSVWQRLGLEARIVWAFGTPTPQPRSGPG